MRGVELLLVLVCRLLELESLLSDVGFLLVECLSHASLVVVVYRWSRLAARRSTFVDLLA